MEASRARKMAISVPSPSQRSLLLSSRRVAHRQFNRQVVMKRNGVVKFIVWNSGAARDTAQESSFRGEFRLGVSEGYQPTGFFNAAAQICSVFYFLSFLFVLHTHCGGGNKPDETHILKYLWAFLLLAYDVDNIAWEQNMCALWDQHKQPQRSWRENCRRNSATRKNYIRPEDLPTFSRNITPSNSILFNQCTKPPRSILSYAIPFFRDNKFFGIKTFSFILLLDACEKKESKKN